MTAFRTHSTLFFFSLAVATICLGTGLVLAGSWWGLPALLAFLVCWVLPAERPGFWRTTCAFLGYLVLTAALVIRDVSIYLMLAACAAALTSWELNLFRSEPIPAKAAQAGSTSLERSHLRSVTLAASLGLATSLLALQIRIEIPFGLAAVLGLTTMAAVVFGIRFLINHTGTHRK